MKKKTNKQTRRRVYSRCDWGSEIMAYLTGAGRRCISPYAFESIQLLYLELMVSIGENHTTEGETPSQPELLGHMNFTKVTFGPIKV